MRLYHSVIHEPDKFTKFYHGESISHQELRGQPITSHPRSSLEDGFRISQASPLWHRIWINRRSPSRLRQTTTQLQRAQSYASVSKGQSVCIYSRIYTSDEIFIEGICQAAGTGGANIIK